MAQLRFRPGDSQALKPLIASSMELALKPKADTQLMLLLQNGQQIFDSNAMAEALKGIPTESHVEIHQWLEWESSVLRPLLFLSEKPVEEDIKAAMDLLESGTKKARAISSAQMTLADICIFSTLFPFKDDSFIPPEVRNYVTHLSQHQVVKDAVQKVEPILNDHFLAKAVQMLSGVSESKCRDLIKEDLRHLESIRPKLPISGQRNILVTSALPYVNNVPHLGNIIGCVLSADCYARFCRARGFNTIFICGTDEYGTATETKAYEEGVSCEEICEKYHKIHREIYEWFEISCDKFGRTPTRHQTKIAQQIFSKLTESNNVVENEMQQLFSEALGKFLADRFIIGTCPKCSYEDARGDQCDQCGTLLNPTELVNPKCKFTGTVPVMKSTKHIFIDLPKLVEPLKKYIEETSQLGGWSSNCLQITNAWLRDGLKQRCITRDLKWGVPVPLPGYETKVFYVWFDAPIGYISITADYTPDWEQWWKNPEVELVQFMGKDNVPFHTVIFPSTLIGTGESWTMMKKISVTEYLNYESGKFSKSRGTGVFGDNARESGIPVEVWRYYLLSNRPESQDSTFVWDNLGAQNNAELLNNLGNFVNRALKFVEKFYESVIPDGTAVGEAECKEVGVQLKSRVDVYIEKMEGIQLKSALATVMEISGIGNKFLQDNKPWELFKNNPDKCKTIVRAAAGITKIVAALLQPFMPSVSKKILYQLNVSWDEGILLTPESLDQISNPSSILPHGHRINEPLPLFSKISDDELNKFRERFKGKQEDQPAVKKKHPKKSKETPKQPPESSEAVATPKPKEKTKSKPKDKPKEKTKEAPVDISRLDLRVGLIKKAWKHPDADTLYVEEIEVGENEPRTVVSGLVKFIPEAEMQNRLVAVICNMKPVNMRGIKSHAMVLAASAPDKSSVELVDPPQDSAPGDKISVEGFEGEPDAVLNPKKKVFEQIQPELSVNQDSVVCYRGVSLSTSKGVCRVKSLVSGSVA